MVERRKLSDKSGLTRGEARTCLLDAAMMVIRERGYAASTVDDICRAAGVTKGAFFHHFAAKEELAVAATDHFAAMADGFFAAAPYRSLPRAKDRVIGYVRFRQEILSGALAEYTCLLGTMVQEAYGTSPAIRAACEASINAYCEALAPDIDAAIALHGISHGVSAMSLARHVQAVLQGAFIMAKTTDDAAIARDSVTHLKRYILMLFGRG